MTTDQIAAEAWEEIQKHIDWPNECSDDKAIIATIGVAIEKAVENLRNVIKDDCETDTNVRELARPILGDFAVDGDSYGVPGLEDITESLIKLIPPRAAQAGEPCDHVYTTRYLRQCVRCGQIERAAQASGKDPDAAKMIERAQELVDMEEYPNL